MSCKTSWRYCKAQREKDARTIRTLSIVGTRPELIRLSETIKKLDMYTNHCLVFTGQNYDYELSQIFFDELSIRKPNYTLSVKADSLAKQVGNILTQCEEVMVQEVPDVVLVLGDSAGNPCHDNFYCAFGGNRFEHRFPGARVAGGKTDWLLHGLCYNRSGVVGVGRAGYSKAGAADPWRLRADDFRLCLFAGCGGRYFPGNRYFVGEKINFEKDYGRSAALALFISLYPLNNGSS